MGDISHLHDHDQTVDRRFAFNTAKNERGSRDFRESKRPQNRPVSLGQELKAQRLGVDIGEKSHHDLSLELVEGNLRQVIERARERMGVLSKRGFKPGVMIPMEPFMVSSVFKGLYWIAGNVDERGSLELYTVSKGERLILSKKTISIFATQFDKMRFKEPKKK